MIEAAARFLFYWEQPTDIDAFDRHYRATHIPLARKLPGLRSYTLTDDISGVRGEPWFRIAELRWDTMDDLHAAIASDEGRAVADDVANLVRYAAGRAVVLGAPEALV
jgi:uncharacterized protein (TIGR02118 family)